MALKSELGAKTWFVADGWIPSKNQEENSGYEGHEAVMILNCTDENAKVFMDVYFEGKEPVEGIELKIAAKRIKCFRMDKPEEIGGVIIDRVTQYGLRFRSNVNVIVQFGRMDVTQNNLAYIGMLCMPA